MENAAVQINQRQLALQTGRKEAAHPLTGGGARGGADFKTARYPGMLATPPSGQRMMS